ncbi:MAG: glycosyl transferase [Marinilabiliales bacterium]|nr:MAG: glycosyl transferase [Marinilabiliales bacterium]
MVLKENLGRSSIRNKLANTATFSKILFLDCDSIPPTDQFIKVYIENKDINEVICGGTIYNDEQYKPELSLRYWYGINREMTSANERNKESNKSFTTNNFLISKSVFEKLKFREFLNKYGHEDSLFGFELKKNGMSIQHIDNPVIHCGLEDNATFLSKTRCAIDNLILIEQDESIDKDFFNEINLIRAYNKSKKTGLIFIQKLFFNIFGRMIKKNLTEGAKPSMFMLDIYKLDYYSKKKFYEKKKLKNIQS